jgi:hypothetical protein
VETTSVILVHIGFLSNLIPEGQFDPKRVNAIFQPSRSPSSASLFAIKHFMEVDNEVIFLITIGFETSITYSSLTPNGLRVFFGKTTSKQPLLKTSWIVQNWNQFWYFQL